MPKKHDQIPLETEIIMRLKRFEKALSRKQCKQTTVEINSNNFDFFLFRREQHVFWPGVQLKICDKFFRSRFL